jgi:HEAT repeat protein
LKGLEARNIAEIRKAQRVLIEAGRRAAEPILLTMTSDKQWVRRRVMEVILKLKDPAFIECLVNALADDSGRVRRMAISALIDFGDAAKAQLEEAANSDNPMLRANAIRALGYIEGEQSLGIAISALESTNVNVKAAAIKSLIKIRDERALKALRSALWDASSSVSLKAAYALSSFGAEGQEMLKDALAQAKAEGAAQVARCIAHGLVMGGDESGLDLVAAALYDESWGEWTTPLIIARLKHPRGNDALVEFFESVVENPGMTFSVQPALTAMGEIEDSRAIPLLLEFLKGRTDKGALKTGVKVLQSKGKEAVPALVQMIQRDNYPLAQRATNALVKIGQDALPEVEKALMEMEQGSRSWKLLDRASRQIGNS